MQSGAPEPSVPAAAEPTVRFEATVHGGARELSLERVADFDLDRVPDPEGGVRVLITAEDAAQLVAQGYEVLLVRTLPVQPLDSAQVMSDDSAGAWLEAQTGGIQRHEGS